MKLSENDVAFMRDAKRIADGSGNATFEQASPHQRQAFKKLEERGYVEGQMFMNGSLEARVTADGRQALRETGCWPSFKGYLAERVTAVFDQLLSHVLALLVGILSGWLLGGGGQGQNEAPSNAPAVQADQGE